MAERKKINFQGQDVWAEEVDFETESENWNTYILHDGTKLKLKTVLAAVLRLDIYKQDGEPVYVVNASPVIAAAVPERLKKKQ